MNPVPEVMDMSDVDSALPGLESVAQQEQQTSVAQGEELNMETIAVQQLIHKFKQNMRLKTYAELDHLLPELSLNLSQLELSNPKLKREAGAIILSFVAVYVMQQVDRMLPEEFRFKTNYSESMAKIFLKHIDPKRFGESLLRIQDLNKLLSPSQKDELMAPLDNDEVVALKSRAHDLILLNLANQKCLPPDSTPQQRMAVKEEAKLLFEAEHGFFPFFGTDEAPLRYLYLPLDFAMVASASETVHRKMIGKELSPAQAQTMRQLCAQRLGLIRSLATSPEMEEALTPEFEKAMTFWKCLEQKINLPSDINVVYERAPGPEMSISQRFGQVSLSMNSVPF